MQATQAQIEKLMIVAARWHVDISEELKDIVALPNDAKSAENIVFHPVKHPGPSGERYTIVILPDGSAHS